MKKFDSKFKDVGYLVYRWLYQIADPIKFYTGFPNYLWYFKDLITYFKFKNSEPFELINTYPCLHDKTTYTSFDSHYFYQDIWAFKRILSTKTTSHVDVGSRIDFVGFLSAITKVTFIDIRPLKADLEGFESRKGSILSMPFESNSVASLSCLHVAEHIGLGRYGDPIDPMGTEEATKELSRVLAREGNLFFSLPIGKPRICFNAHRIHSVEQILSYFPKLELIELSGIDDKGLFTKDISIDILDECNYGCGMFWFKKP